MTMFLSTHPSHIDSKGRLSIPAPFQTTLKQHNTTKDTSVIFRPSHFHACLEGWTASAFVAFFASLIEHTSLAGVIVFMGLGRIFQVWSPEAAEKRRNNAQKHSKMIGHRAPSKARNEIHG